MQKKNGAAMEHSPEVDELTDIEDFQVRAHHNNEIKVSHGSTPKQLMLTNQAQPSDRQQRAPLSALAPPTPTQTNYSLLQQKQAAP